jgi:DNA-binding NarL/FixJ family response regulator
MKNILSVDDHPFVLDTYVKMLKNIISFKFEKILEATNVEKAISVINETKKIDIAFFDISMPKNNASNMEDGIDLALYFKTKHPNAKIVFITMHTEFHILLKNIHLVNPEVFISKNDVDNFTFNSILEALKKDKLFYSEEMLNVLKWTKKSKIKLDIYDFKILSLTNKGVKTKELTNHLPLSLRAIEKRKSNLKLITTDFE